MNHILRYFLSPNHQQNLSISKNLNDVLNKHKVSILHLKTILALKFLLYRALEVHVKRQRFCDNLKYLYSRDAYNMQENKPVTKYEIHKAKGTYISMSIF